MIELLLILFGTNQYSPNQDLYFADFQVTYILDSTFQVQEIIYNKKGKRFTEFELLNEVINYYHKEFLNYEKSLGFAILQRIKLNYRIKYEFQGMD